MDDPPFTPGQMADEDKERIAEDGFTTKKTDKLNNTDGIEKGCLYS